MGPDLALLQKALAETDISALFKIPEIDQMMVQLVDFLNPLRQNLRRVPGSGDSYLVYTRTPGTTQAVDIDDVDTITEQVGTYGEVTFPYRTIATQGRISRRVQKTGRSIADLMREELEAKAGEIRNAEDYRMFWGNYPTVNAKQFNGLAYQLNANTGQIVTAGTDGTSGNDLTTAKMDQVIDTNIGNPGLIVTSRLGRRKINALLQAQQRFVDRTEIAGGFRVISYNDIPIVATTNIPDVLTRHPSTGTITALTGGSTSALFVIDLQDVFMSVLTELTVMPLAKVSSQYDLFDIFMDEALVVRDFRHLSMLSGIRAV
jgi:HK97 family phage major capsid protein